MKNIIVTTDFTESSRNALAYTCGLTSDGEYRLFLIHVYTVPVNYTSDGVALTAIKDAFDNAEDRLAVEMEWVNNAYPAVQIESRVMIGGLIASLNEQIAEVRPEMIVMGAAQDYEDLWTWDSELLAALTDLSVPVLLIPRQIAFSPIRNIGFASDYINLCTPGQINSIKRLANYTGAQLHVVHITRSKPQNDDVRKGNEEMMQEMLLEVKPLYYAIEDPNVIDAVAHFVKEQKLDLLIVIPHTHDTWYSIFHQSHTKQLARLNNMPILALHD
jgi:hypothetical protein